MATSMRYKIVVVIILIITIIAAFFLFNRKESNANQQKTDDAYVKADATMVSPQIAGLIQKVNVEDHQYVKQGQELVAIDDRDSKINLKNAEASLMTKKADLLRIRAQIEQQKSLINQAKASIQIDHSNLNLASEDMKRYSRLAQDGSGTIQAKQQAETQYKVQQGQLSRNQAILAATQDQVSVLQADYEKAKADILVAEANIDAVKLNFSYTKVNAPINGYIMQKQARVGAYSQVGKPLMAIVPLSSIYIEANYRETQLEKIKSGQKVEIKVDALPDVILEGVVESVGAASGVSFSNIAPHNATGNFTKIVQRLPVRIKVDSNQKDFSRLRVGMSVIPTIFIQ